MLTGTLTVSALTVPTSAVAKPKTHLSAQQEKLDSDGAPAKGRAWPSKPVRSADLAAPVWPKPGKASVTLPAAAGGQRRATAPAVKAGDLPVSVGRAGGAAGARTQAVSVEVLDRTATPAQWRDGLLLRVAPQATATATAKATGTGAAAVSVDYRSFKNAYGASWASRLKLWQVPECALSTPAKAGCSATPLASRNDGGAVSADVPLPAVDAGARTTATASTLVALAAGASGTEGDLAATPLSVSSTWSAGTSTGGFSWSYPMRVPPSNGGPAPSIGLAYSSDRVDGQSDASNSQPSWIGEGFDFWPGYIERSYVSCADDMTGGNNSTNRTADQCWRSDNATMSLNGRGTELVFEAGKGWHGRSEDGSKIEKLTGATNGDNDGEYWKVTTTDGTQYFFGRHNLPGETAVTSSTWTVPVSGNQSVEPCYNTSFASSFCDQAWRWNLDYVVDPRGNTMSYWYTPETNYYARNATSTTKARYDRGGTLKQIDYGTWDRSSTDRKVTPTAMVTFTVADRCAADCTIHDAAHWKDVPWDQECTSTATNCGQNYAPTFWSTKRLSKITTQVYDTTKTTPAWQQVESWTLNHSWPAVGDGSDHAGMWLTSLVRTGLVGGTDAMPPITFEPVAKPNRVLTKNNTTNNRMRMGNIITETGSKIQVSYSTADCASGNLPATTYGNTRRCYPVITPDPYNYTGPDITEWWHKYVVTQVSESDLAVVVGGTDHGQPVQNTYYNYVGPAAWHYADDNGLIKPRRKTWNQFRGYGQVEVRKGDAPSQTLTRTTFLRGMHGDRASTSGGTRSITVGASLGSETVYDEDQFAGMVREQVVYNGVDTKPVSKTVNVPWMSPALATRTINGDTVTARWTNTRVGYAGTALGVNGAGGWRVTSTESTFDDTYGSTTSAQDNGDVAKAGDEKCFTYFYNRNTTKNLTQLVKRTTAVALKCGVSPASTADVLADEQKFYDGATSVDTAPSYGAVTRVDKLKDWSVAGGTVWQTESQATFDVYGRPATATDARNNKVTTTYTPATGGPVTRVTTSTPDPNGGTTPWTTTIDQLPYWGSPSRTTDFNGRVSDMEYDPSGRLKRGWDAGWTKADHPTSPLVEHTYVFAPNRDAYPYVKSSKLHAGGGYRTSYQIFDAFLRPRQSQSLAVGGGRVVTDTLYDKAGRADTGYQPHVEPGTPAGALWWEPEWSVPALTKTIYDNASRATDQVFYGTDGVTNLVEKWRTTTQYLGDSTKVTPPAGGTVTTAKSDAQGRTVELLQRVDPTQVKPDLSTRYAYNKKGQLERVTDSLGNEWVNTYDVKGRQISAEDPDKGTTSTEYNVYDEPSKTTDANGKVLLNEYDSMGRRTALYEGSIAAANKRAEWKYDKLDSGKTLRGQLTQSIRYEATAGTTYAYTYRITGVNERYQVTGADYLIPAAEGSGLTGTYSYSMGYSPYTGEPTSLSYPAGGGLTNETVTTDYDATTGLPTALNTTLINVGRYVIGQQYTAYGEPTLTTRKIDGGVYVEDATSYDLTTRRVDRYTVKPETATGTVQDTTYQYQDIGNITSIKDAPEVGAADTQCFGYDALRRLTSAWTPKSGVDCATAPTVANLGGPAPYWYDWTVDEIGNRRTETAHTSLGDTTRTYSPPASGQGKIRPHAVDSVATQAPGPATPVTTKYAYDAAGNMTCRPTGAAANDCATGSNSQVLGWNSEGKLATVTAGGQSVETNIYDANGARLIRRDATGTTLYLPGQELRRDKATTAVTGTRYYSFAGSGVATRNPTSLTWLYSDHQGTQQVGIDANSQQVSVRRQTPYGDPRGTQPQWSNPKGFVGGDKDPTGLTHIGARDYDPGLGRFVSVDPLQDLSDPQAWNAYAYSNNSPISFSDPTGLSSCSDDRCGPGADYEDLFGNYVEVEGDNDGCGGACNDAEWAKARVADEKIKRERSNGGGGHRGGSGGSGSSGNSGVGGKGGSSGPSAEDIRHAKQVKEQSVTAVILKAGGKLLLDLFGVTDILDCIHGDVKACAWTLVGLLPAGKAVRLLGKIKPLASMLRRSGRALLKWSDDVKWADEVLEQAEACLIKHSFAPGTKVRMADGDEEPIEKLEVGDEVLATDPETGATEARAVTRTHTNLDKDLTDVTVVAGDGSESVLKTTQHHPFWSEDRHDWIDAVDLRVDEDLRALDGSRVSVKLVRSYTGAKVMHDLTVAEIHTYYVTAGETPVLVHNCGGLDWSRAKVQTNGVDAVETHLLRFADGGALESAEQGMLNRLRSISAGEMEATPHDLRFYTHELRESVLYRKAGYRTGQPESGSYELWDQLHTQSLNDYGLTRAGAPNDLYHPSVR
ncbi:polymorphic toxin-type HINT domain-containing protein [Micromonospora auratinigra]|uniref:polymorphic toxin-type HINT domain-containing protein n=1 Tax=Micromonospora auratinigra TaxID=261654 RepID=UPI0012FDC7E3|nr:polymorphic toxin-type HINT domain-containing protein [Micromonospora auratinigra]